MKVDKEGGREGLERVRKGGREGDGSSVACDILIHLLLGMSVRFFFAVFYIRLARPFVMCLYVCACECW